MADEEKLRDYLRRVTVDLHDALQRLQDLEGKDREPLAIVGMSCRYPGGVHSPQDLWELVAEGVDAICPFPADRGWDLERLSDPDPERLGASSTQRGGFLGDAGDFDADFFGINPREALTMDPQQRLLLEGAWEAIEDAGIDLAALKGSQTGVFAGVSSSGYGPGPFTPVAGLEGYQLTGTTDSVVSGRVSYTFGLEGPAVSVDTACSSSLVALHLACNALRSGECSLALAGGVTVLAASGVFVSFSRQGGLSPDGRCKSYGETADGVGWSEGMGVLVLERLSDARRNGHDVLAVVRGSAINQDGASNGLTAPNGPSQQRVITQALANALLSPGQVDVVEGHGTGTVLGDPIEAQALLATYGQNRSNRPLWLGSIKSNIGHSVAAAGVAGVIKMVMAMRHSALPRTLHVDKPSSQVDWSAGQVSLLTEERPWQRNGEPRRAGVSSFGISGTNAHAILEEAPPADPSGTTLAEHDNGNETAPKLAQTPTDDPAFARLLNSGAPWVVSGKGVGALRGQAERLRVHLGGAPELDSADVAVSLAGRSVFEHRAVVLGGSREEMLAGLDALAVGELAAGVVQGLASVAGDAGSVFLFPGQGSQWVGMAVGLLECSPVFAGWVGVCGEALGGYVDWVLEDVLRGVSGAPGLERVDVVQPVLFAVMVSLAGLWRACGVVPSAVVGHSQGEIAAAYVAGGLSLQDAVRLVALRSRALVKLAGKGGMVSVVSRVGELERRLERWGGRIGIAAVNGPSSVVVSGDLLALEELLVDCEAGGVRARKIPVDYAAHSVHVEEIREELLDACSTITPSEGDVPFFSTVTGGLLETSRLDGDYWYRNLRETVQFEQATSKLLSDGRRTFIEVSPHPVLTIGVQETVEQVVEDPSDVLVTGTLRRDEGGPERFTTALAQAWVHGINIDWQQLFDTTNTAKVKLPTYAFQRQRFWLLPTTGSGDAASIGLSSADHPLLGAMVELADGEQWLFTARISLESHPWLVDHAVLGTVLLPGTVFLELALAVGERVGAHVVEELVVQAPLVLADHGAVHLQISVGEPSDAGQRSLTIHSRPEQVESIEEQWTCHVTGALAQAVAVDDRAQALQARAALLADASWPPAGAEAIDVDGLYDRLAERGIDYGPVFQGLQAAWQRGEELFAEVALSPEQQSEASSFGVHPALLDAALHAGFTPSSNEGAVGEGVRLPFCWTGVELYSAGASSLRVMLTSPTDGTISLLVADDAGHPVASIESLTTREIPAGQLQPAGALGDSLFGLEWSVVSPSTPELPTALALLDTNGGSLLARSLSGAGCMVEVYPDLRALGRALEDGASLPSIVLADCDPGESTEVDGLAVMHNATNQALALIQDWLADPRFVNARLVLLTKGAVAAGAGEGVPGLAQSPLWGLARSAQTENPGRLVLVDVDGDQASWGALPGALVLDEPQLAIRAASVLVPRLVRAGSGVLAVPEGASEWQLQAAPDSSFEDLSLVAAPAMAEPLAAGQVRVGVRAAGLNFRDLLIVLGMYPGDATIGGEGAGVVLELGPDVEGLAVGDRVMGLMVGGFGPVVVTDHRLLARVPDGWSFTQAASVPTVFLTAYYGLLDLANLKEGEKVLVHAGTGGVGMAAVQLAKHLGAEVFATASPAKWDTLRALGLDDTHIANSRTLDFKQPFLHQTDGRGVDVVLNSLAGEFVDASLELLATGGRFVEMGKTDIRDAQEVAERHRGVTYRAFDMIEAGAERIQEMLRELIALFDGGVLDLLPVKAWDIRHAPDAFRFMSQARHTGKLVLSMPVPIGVGGTVLITGGTGTLGGLLARHLVSEHGVSHLLLTSRRGGDAEGAAQLRAELELLGVEVTIAACDVSDRAALQVLLDAIPAEQPLRGVVHAAGVLDDGVIDSLTSERLDWVLEPKADAAWHLHDLTRHLDLSMFVLFSSAAGTFGSPGQGNYAAANTFLDALAAQRRSEGLPAVSIAWGLWEQASEMTGDLTDADRDRMSRSGIAMLSAEQGLDLFDLATASSESLAVATPIDVRALRTLAGSGILPPLLTDLVLVPARRASNEAKSLARRLAVTPETERANVVLGLVRTQVATVLGHASPDQIDPKRAFKDLGFDSLTAVELRNRLNTETGLRLPVTLVFDYPNTAAVTEHVLNELSGITTSAVKPANSTMALDEPLAIVGMSCRYPGGVASPEQLWQLVATGTDAIADFPSDRGWDLDALYDPDSERPGTCYAREGGFVDTAGDFDAAFFGISPREALTIDPQQRLLLEGAWEAIEDAGIDPAALTGSQTGVFTGVISSYYGLTSGGGTADAGEGYGMTGTISSVASGRIAYIFGLEGPAISVDTACSSSLVAMHLACQALRNGECSLALAGGVTVLATPGVFTEFSRQKGLSRGARCKPFADSADGTGFSEGVGLLVLERLSDAERSGHNVLAVVRGSAVNQDGASNGLTAPNGPSQQRVITQALANARLSPGQIDVVEAHGTGTILGDPIEAQALLATYGQNRTNGPLLLGSIKSNIGHTQAAAGVAGVIKMVQAIRHGVLPRSLHIDAPSSKVDWSTGEVELLTEQRPWQSNGEPRRAGVSSFGISGTNAHLILEQAPATTATDDDGVALVVDTSVVGGLVPWVVSGKGVGALRGQAERLRVHLGGAPELDSADVAVSLAGRSVFEHRAVVLGGSREEMLAGLDALAVGEPAAGVIEGSRSGGGLVFLFTGQGSQRVGMGRELYEASGVFRDALDGIFAEFDKYLERPLVEVLFAAEDTLEAKLIDHTEFTQASLFALEVALFRLIEGLGVRPDFLLGHSIGELAAAHVAGVFSLEDACRLVAARGRLMGALPAGGAMVSIQASEQEVAPTLNGYEDRVSLAAVNGPVSVVISGEEDAVVELQGVWEQRDRKTKRLRVSHAFHSPRMDAMLDEFAEVANTVEFSPPRIPVVSNLTGEPAPDEQICTADYWVRHVREAVRFMAGVQWLHSQGANNYLELGPDTTLSTTTQTAVDDQGVVAVSLLRGDRPQLASVLRGLAEIWVRGVEIDWGKMLGGAGARGVELPTYAFQRERFWLTPSVGSGDVSASGLSSSGHPLLGAMVELADGEQWLFTARITLDSHPWLADHMVLGTVLLPGTAFLEMALHAGEQAGCPIVQELVLEAPLLLSAERAAQLQVSITDPDDAARRSLSIYSRPECGSDQVDEVAWTRHATGMLTPADASLNGQAGALNDHAASLADESWPPDGAEAVDVDGLYDRLVERGIEYGPAFQGLQAAWRRGEEMFAEVTLAPDQHSEASSFGVHPALLDASLHAAFAGSRESRDEGGVRLPFSLNGVQLYSAGASSLRVALSPTAENAIRLVVADDAGHPVATIDSLTTREIPAGQLQPAGAPSDSLFRLSWTAVPASVPELPTALALIGGSPLAEALAGAGCTVDAYPDLRALGRALEDGASLPSIVLADCDPGENTDAGELAAMHDATNRVLALVQDWLADPRFANARLVALTKGAVAVTAGTLLPGLAQSPTWGLVRSAQTENPGRLTLLDTDNETASSDVLANALALDEPQLAIRAGSVLVPRLARAGSGVLAVPEGVSEWRLQAGAGGTFEDLSLVAAPDVAEPLAAGQVRVGVRAAGLNFRDVLIALRMYPGDATIGGEGAGVVLELGPDVEALAVGDRVMGLMAGGFGPVAVADQRLLARLPDRWSFAQAASVPTVFLTAYYGLLDLANLKEGEKVLVHAGAGGVGMAAVQLAKHLGAEVFATASPAKWDSLRALGLDDTHIASSRTLDFSERFEASGIDVVLNSLAGEFVDGSLRLLRGGGRFVEMGKTDIRNTEEVSEQHPGVLYRAFDLVDAGSDRIEQMLAQLVELFEAGELRPLPLRSWDVRHAPDAFRFMSQARHTGKLVLSMPVPIGVGGTVLITGGTGTLGGLLARHLVSEHGVSHLLLTSRRGGDAEGAAQLRAELELLGVEVTIAACDVSDRAALQVLLDAIPAEQPLRGVVHAAGVLDDGVIDSLTSERLDWVLEPKADAAWHLHDLTRHLDLSMFVLFSSAAGTFGSPGQGNYAAANTFLDALAAQRRSEGLPAVSIAWGLWEQASEMTGDLTDADRDRMSRSGIAMLSAEQGLDLFDLATASSESLAVATPIDVRALRTLAGSGILPPLFADLLRSPSRRSRDRDESLAQRLAAISEADRESFVLELVRAQAAVVLGHSSSNAIDPRMVFKDLGFDSLGAVEMRNRLSAATGMNLPATLVFDYPTTVAVTEYLLSEVSNDSVSRAPVDRDLERLERSLPSITDDEAERGRIAARLRVLLGGLEGTDAGGADEEDLDSASDDEMFALIDRELAES